VCQNLVPLVNIKIAGKWMFIPLKMVLIGIDPFPSQLSPNVRSGGFRIPDSGGLGLCWVCDFCKNRLSPFFLTYSKALQPGRDIICFVKQHEPHETNINQMTWHLHTFRLDEALNFRLVMRFLFPRDVVNTSPISLIDSVRLPGYAMICLAFPVIPMCPSLSIYGMVPPAVLCHG